MIMRLPAGLSSARGSLKQCAGLTGLGLLLSGLRSKTSSCLASEAAALRSLANAARMAANNPALIQLRLLQQLDGSAGHTVVIGTSAAAGSASPDAVSP